MAEIELRVLGGFELCRNDAALSALPGKKAQALLAYLALSAGRLQNREHLAALLWGDRQDEQARQSLRQAVSSLRKILGDEASRILVSDGDGLRLETAEINVDALRFEGTVSQTAPEHLQEALEIFQGDLLASLGSISEEFDSWLAAERSRYQDLAADALDRLSARTDNISAGESMAALAGRLLKLDPLNEPAHRALMRHYYGKGQRSLAIRQYKQLSDMLKRELDLEPDIETRQIFERVQAAPARNRVDQPEGAGGVGAAIIRTARHVPRPAVFAAACLLLLVIAGGVYLASGPPLTSSRHEAGMPPGTPGPHVGTSIAVLPFRTATKDERERALAFGLGQGITTALSMISNLSVISGNPGRADPGTTPQPDLTAARTGAHYVLEGSIQLAERSVHITATLTDTSEQRKLWTQLYHRPVNDIFSLQNEIILNLVTALQIELSEGEQARISLVSGTRNLEAWLLAGQALQEIRRLTPEHIIKARANYEQALRLDPNYTGAKGGLAWTYLIEILFGGQNDVESSVAIASALGTELTKNKLSKAGGYGILSWVELLRGNHEKAVLLGEKAIKAKPMGADYVAQFAFVLTFTGEHERAIKLMERAIRLSPSPPDWFFWNLGRAQRLAGRHEESLANLRRAGVDFMSPIYLAELTAALAAAGREEEARRAANRLLRLRPEFSVRNWVRLPPYKDPGLAQRDMKLLIGTGLPK